MGFRLGLIHDFMALLACLAIAILASFTQPFTVSLGLLLLSLSLWLLFTSPLARAEYRVALDPRISRASLGSVLLLISVATLSSTAGLDARATALLVILVVATVVLYIYYLSKHSSSR